MENQIMKKAIIQKPYGRNARQYVLKVWLDTGEIEEYRLSGCIATARTFDLEPPKIREQVELAILNAVRLQQNALSRPKGPYKTCDDAMEAYLNHYEQTRIDRTYRDKAKSFREFAGKESLRQMTPAFAKTFIELLISQDLKYDTVRLRVAPPAGMIEWLRSQGLWNQVNPFHGLIKKYAYQFDDESNVLVKISDEQHKNLLEIAMSTDKYQSVETFIMIARYTGLRESEILRLNTDKLDIENLSWGVQIKKVRGRKLFRHIAIPQVLAAFIVNKEITGALAFPGLKNYFVQVRREAMLPENLKMKSFRKDFAHRMEEAGASADEINLHQCRLESGVLHKHYLTDPYRAVKICRPYIDRMFTETTRIRRVK